MPVMRVPVQRRFSDIDALGQRIAATSHVNQLTSTQLWAAGRR